VFASTRFIVLAGVLLASSPLYAQSSTCPNVSFDAFSMARQARRIVADYQNLHETHQDDMQRLALLYSLQTGRKKPWSFSVAGLVDWDNTFGFDACTNQGPWQAKLNPLMLGGVASFELDSIGLGVEGFALLAIDRLEATPTTAQTMTADGGVKDPTGLANIRADQSMYGGRLSYRDLATVVTGVISSAPVENTVGVDGREFIFDGATDAEPDRIYMGAGIPRFNVYSHIIFDEKDVRADQFEIRAERLPLPYYELNGLLGIRYLNDEGQLILDLGVGNILKIISVDISVEHSPFNLRHARLRADFDKSWGWEPEDLTKIEPGLEAYPRFAFDMGAFAETSWFQSRYLEEQTGNTGAWGVAVGAFVRPDLTIFVNRIDFLVGVNQPERIENLSEVANHWNFGVRLYSRFGL